MDNILLELHEVPNGSNNTENITKDDYFSVRMTSVGSIRISKSLKMLKNEEEIFVSKEKETQMFLFLLLILHVVFILPLNIFK